MDQQSREKWGCTGEIKPDLFGHVRKYQIGGQVFFGCPLRFLHDPSVSYALRLYPSFERSGAGPNGPLANETAYYRNIMETIDQELAEARSAAFEDSSERLKNGKTKT